MPRLSPGLKKEASPVDSRIAVEPCVVRKGSDPLLGGRHYTAVFTFFRLNPDNTFAGTQRITENIELSHGADSFTSTGTSGIFDTNGTLIREGCITEVATRAQ